MKMFTAKNSLKFFTKGYILVAWCELESLLLVVSAFVS